MVAINRNGWSQSIVIGGRNQPVRPCRVKPAGFSFAFAGYGELLIAPFKSVLLGVADVTGEINLAAHRRSNFL